MGFKGGKEMKASELRISNWVYDCGDIHEFSIHDFELLSIHSPAIENYEPIPLTEEWLINMGFEEDRAGHRELTKNGFTIFFEVFSDHVSCYLEMIGVDILYIHQLQNLIFALWGEELIIKENE